MESNDTYIAKEILDVAIVKRVWFAIEQEATRYTEEAFNRLSEIHTQRLAYLYCH